LQETTGGHQPRVDPARRALELNFDIGEKLGDRSHVVASRKIEHTEVRPLGPQTHAAS